MNSLSCSQPADVTPAPPAECAATASAVTHGTANRAAFGNIRRTKPVIFRLRPPCTGVIRFRYHERPECSPDAGVQTYGLRIPRQAGDLYEQNDDPDRDPGRLCDRADDS